MAIATGLEPAASRVTGERSNQLSYAIVVVVVVVVVQESSRTPTRTPGAGTLVCPNCEGARASPSSPVEMLEVVREHGFEPRASSV
jgi:hypothetical protein